MNVVETKSDMLEGAACSNGELRVRRERKSMRGALLLVLAATLLAVYVGSYALISRRHQAVNAVPVSDENGTVVGRTTAFYYSTNSRADQLLYAVYLPIYSIDVNCVTGRVYVPGVFFGGKMHSAQQQRVRSVSQ